MSSLKDENETDRFEDSKINKESRRHSSRE